MSLSSPHTCVMTVTLGKSYLVSNPVPPSCGKSGGKWGITVCQRNKPTLRKYTGDAIMLPSSFSNIFKAALP